MGNLNCHIVETEGRRKLNLVKLVFNFVFFLRERTDQNFFDLNAFLSSQPKLPLLKNPLIIFL